jgi:peptidoglycan/xylan/chitin deacetylase (PgdA/CDA1 family)
MSGAAISVSFDNLGEAAELERGDRDPGEPLGDHYSVTTALPKVLELLAEHEIAATFFVEGLNAEVYPDALREIRDAGHEVGFHAWRHEQWGSLDPDAEADNLDRGLAALRGIGLEPAGFRPPGGLISESTLTLLRERGLEYCSPAGTAAGVDEVAVLPFEWPNVDAFHVLPAFAELRERKLGSDQAGGPEAIRETLLAAVDGAGDGDALTLVLHTVMIEMELDAVRDVLARVRARENAGEVWVARCDEVARRLAARDPAPAPELDTISWDAQA